MQPTYLPWAGYFNLIGSVDKFVFLDDVQFEHQSWQTRNRILLQGREHLLVVPVRNAPLATPICEVAISANDRWRSKHWGSLKVAYSRAPHGDAVLGLLEPVLAGPPPGLLSELDQSIIVTMAKALGFGATFHRASEMGCGGKRSEHLVQLCAALDCDEYVSPRGSSAYLQEDGFEGMSSVRLSFQDFVPRPYSQVGSGPFVSHLSIVDVIANLGIEGAKEYCSGDQGG